MNGYHFFTMLSKCKYIEEEKQIIIEIVREYLTDKKACNLLKIFNSTVYPMFDNASNIGSILF